MPSEKVKDRAVTVGFVMVVVLIFTGFVLLGWSAWVYQDDGYQILAPEKHRATLVSENTIEVYREFQIVRELLTIYIDRELVNATRDSTGAIVSVRAAVAPTEVTYRTGVYKNRRILQIPIVPAGLYQLISRVCWHMPVARRCVTLPALEIAIP